MEARALARAAVVAAAIAGIGARRAGFPIAPIEFAAAAAGIGFRVEYFADAAVVLRAAAVVAAGIAAVVAGLVAGIATPAEALAARATSAAAVVGAVAAMEGIGLEAKRLRNVQDNCERGNCREMFRHGW